MKKQLNLSNACVCGVGLLAKSNAKLCSGEEVPGQWVRPKENI